MACANGRRFPITRYLYDEACGGSPLFLKPLYLPLLGRSLGAFRLPNADMTRLRHKEEGEHESAKTAA